VAIDFPPRNRTDRDISRSCSGSLGHPHAQ
jgi:hypothetical protein